MRTASIPFRAAVSALLIVLAASVSALPASNPAAVTSLQARAVPSPAEDPFYTPPAGLDSQAPGTVLRSRKVDIGIFGLLPSPVEAYQLLYRTTAINGTAIATVTTVFKPQGKPKTDRFVSFATAEDSNGVQCAPSYTYRLGADQASVIVTAESLILQVYLAQGYIVNSPDYEGPDGAFGAGRLSGRGVLDSMRAVKNFKTTLGLTTDDPAIVGVGYSGGGIATGWAAGLQPTYASELNIKGWASGGTPANLSAVVDLIDGTIWAGFLPAAITGLSSPSAYGAVAGPLVQSLATESGKEALAFSKTHCAIDDLGHFAFQKIKSTKFQKLGDQFLYQPDIADIINDQTMGLNASEHPTAPILLYHSKADEIIPYEPTATLAKTWCDQGSIVSLLTLGNGGHISGELVGVVEASKWVNLAFDGALPTACTSKTVLNSLLNPLALGFALEPILLKLIDLLGTLGNNDENVKANPSILAQPVSLRP